MSGLRTIIRSGIATNRYLLEYDDKKLATVYTMDI